MLGVVTSREPHDHPCVGDNGGPNWKVKVKTTPTRWCSAFRRHHILLEKAGSCEPHVVTGSLPRAVDTRSELLSHRLPSDQPPSRTMLGWASSCKEVQWSSAPWWRENSEVLTTPSASVFVDMCTCWSCVRLGSREDRIWSLMMLLDPMLPFICSVASTLVTSAKMAGAKVW